MKQIYHLIILISTLALFLTGCAGAINQKEAEIHFDAAQHMSFPVTTIQLENSTGRHWLMPIWLVPIRYHINAHVQLWPNDWIYMPLRRS